MKLFVDIGNSAIKWASDSDLRSRTVHTANSHCLPQAIDLAWSEISEPSEVHIASVRRQKTLDELMLWIANHWQAKVRIARTMLQELGVQNGYSTPSQLGVDRWLAMLAAFNTGGGPVLVVDCGSATTIDGLDGAGNHLGGLILPGVQLYAKCLESGTDLSIDANNMILQDLSTDTSSCVQNGALLSHLCVVERSVTNLERQCGTSAACILTGGEAPLLSEYLQVTHRLIPDLVLQGLVLQSNQVTDL